MDDHVPLIEAGVPCIDIIDFDYPYWHTTEDTPDKCSAESLEMVGKLILALIY
jgi:Zn-dependent M28 family amino/carboxypeptidase